MRPWFLVLAVAGCVSDVDESGASGSYSGDLTITSARLEVGFVTYGSPLRSYKIRLISADTCTAAAIAEVEVNLQQSEGVPPVGPLPFRTMTNPTVLPSALFKSGATTLISGTVNITAASALRLDGTFDAMVMRDGIPTPVTGSFAAPTCQ